VKDKHFKDSTLDRDQLEEEIEKSIRTLKVRELEKITKKQPNSENNPKFEKRKSIPGPLRKTKPKHVSTQPEKRFRPFDPVFHSQNLIQSNKVNQISTKMEIELHQKVKEKVIEKVETISSGEEFSEPVDLMNAQVFGCVFCYKKLKDYKKAFGHYLLHCNVFIECAKCDQKFTDLGKFRFHNSAHNENCNLLNLNKFKVVRKWVQRFLNYFNKQKEELIRLTCDMNQVYCPVCLMMSSFFNINRKSGLNKDQTIETHIDQCFSYSRVHCNYEGIKTEFCLD